MIPFWQGSSSHSFLYFILGKLLLLHCFIMWSSWCHCHDTKKQSHQLLHHQYPGSSLISYCKMFAFFLNFWPLWGQPRTFLTKSNSKLQRVLKKKMDPKWVAKASTKTLPDKSEKSSSLVAGSWSATCGLFWGLTVEAWGRLAGFFSQFFQQLFEISAENLCEEISP